MVLKGLAGLCVALAVGLIAAAWLTAPRPFDPHALPDHQPDPVNGERLFVVGGCMGCHAPPDGAANPDLPIGGAALKTPVGVFYPPNLTPHEATGLGNWSAADFVNALMNGASPAGDHYFPSFPYTSYRRMTVEDMLDMWAYLRTLPPVENAAPPHDLPVAWLTRPLLGLWKLHAMPAPGFVPDGAQPESWNRGAYIVRGPGHCGECHTPRDMLMAMDEERFLAGGPHPDGEGKVPSLRGLIERKRYDSAEELYDALKYGELLGYDSVSSGGMGKVQEALAALPEDDLRAIVEYLVSLE